MTDPCGGNTRGGDGCTCDPPFGWAAAIRARADAYICRHLGHRDTVYRAIGLVRRECRRCGRVECDHPPLGRP